MQVKDTPLNNLLILLIATLGEGLGIFIWLLIDHQQPANIGLGIAALVGGLLFERISVYMLLQMRYNSKPPQTAIALVLPITAVLEALCWIAWLAIVRAFPDSPVLGHVIGLAVFTFLNQFMHSIQGAYLVMKPALIFMGDQKTAIFSFVEALSAPITLLLMAGGNTVFALIAIVGLIGLEHTIQGAKLQDTDVKEMFVAAGGTV
ncbi:MAG: hypothetical protein MUF87_08280 [Anaerolineae bacterium]|jgi:hypothetical protein|nr:hypothetical protein [Anaerolineae bacterium]